MEPVCDGYQWPVHLDHRRALHRLEEGRWRAGNHQGNKRHAWETACTCCTQSPLLYYEEMCVWLIDPAQCTGVFVIQGSPGGGSDLAGGSVQSLPAHLTKEVVHRLGDVRSAVQLERVCRETRELVTSPDPDVWIDRRAGVLPAAAVDVNWLATSKSLLAVAIGCSRAVAVDWPAQATERSVCGSVIRKWSTRQPTLSPVYFHLCSTDYSQRVVVSIGGCPPAGDQALSSSRLSHGACPTAFCRYNGTVTDWKSFSMGTVLECCHCKTVLCSSGPKRLRPSSVTQHLSSQHEQQLLSADGALHKILSVSAGLAWRNIAECDSFAGFVAGKPARLSVSRELQH